MKILLPTYDKLALYADKRYGESQINYLIQTKQLKLQAVVHISVRLECTDTVSDGNSLAKKKDLETYSSKDDKKANFPATWCRNFSETSKAMTTFLGKAEARENALLINL